MKNFLLTIGLAFFAIAGAAQAGQTKKNDPKKSPAVKKTQTPSPKATAKKPASVNKPSTSSSSSTQKSIDKKPSATPVTKKPVVKKDDKAELEKALAIADPEQKITSLSKFLSGFPRSDQRPRALESLTAARVAVGDAKLGAGDRENGLKLIRLAISQAPVPYPDKLFNGVIAQVPMTLALRGEHSAAVEVALAVEKHAASAPQLIALSNFYLSTENGGEAKRLAEAALKLDERSHDAYITIGTANRLNFDLEAAAVAFAKAAEIDPESVTARQSLAEMKRALGHAEEAVTIFIALLEKDPSDVRSQSGKILSLYDAGKRVDAEAELAKAIEVNSGNFVLLTGAAYWYAAKGENAKAIDLAGKSIAAEPRYVWSYIALGRAYSNQGRYADAEQTLLKARKYGNFPTLEYEIANVRFLAGFYREAAEELDRSFILKHGNIATKLGRRVIRSDKSFSELVANERRASILEPISPDDGETAAKLRALLEFRSALAESTPDAIRVADLTDAFVDGSDKMRFFRQIYAAGELLEKKVAPAKALELSRTAITSVDDGLNAPARSAAIMAAELYAGRTKAIADDKYVVVPEVPKPTLSAIARGRIEEIAGWSLLQQGSNAEAITRLKRATNVLPEKSAWWRSSYWRLGRALEADGKDKEALDAYVKGYQSTEPDAAKYSEIEAIYKRVNKSLDGLDVLIGATPPKGEAKLPEVVATASPEVKVPESIAAATVKPEPTPEIKSEPTPEKKIDIPIEKKEVPIVEKTPDPIATDHVEKVVPKETPAPSVADQVQIAVPEKVEEVKPTPKVEEKPKAAEETEKPVANKVEETKTAANTVETPKTTAEKVPEIGPPKSADENVKPIEAKMPEVKPNPKPAETEHKVVVEKLPETSPTPKPLFEPVIIEIKSSKNAEKDDTEKATVAKASTEPASDLSGRPRVVAGRTIKNEAPPPCTIALSRDSITLNADGGSVGLLVGVDRGDASELKFVSSSPKNIQVTAEPEIAGVSGRSLFVIKSMTPATGIYQVVFSLPCGKKEVSVRVR